MDVVNLVPIDLHKVEVAKQAEIGPSSFERKRRLL